MQETYDLVVIGGGSAGYAAARTAVGLGLSVLVAEGGEVGGLCILRGCMPSKTMIESANRMATIGKAADFGLMVGPVTADAKAIVARKARLVAEFADYRRGQLEDGGFDFVRGQAEFVDPHTVEIRSGHAPPVRVAAKTFLLATGSVSSTIDFHGLSEIGYKDSDTVMEWGEAPESVIVLGAGATGLEFANYFVGIGTKVTLLQRGAQVLKGMDMDVAQSVAEALEKRGVEILCRTALKRAELVDGKKRVLFEHEGQEKSVDANEIIYALGRRPRLIGLGLEAAGVAHKEGRLSMLPTQQTDVPHIFAAGDVAGPHEIVHIAIQQGELAARNAARVIRRADDQFEEMDYRLKLFAIFTEPQVATVGASEYELAFSHSEHLVATYCFNDLGKAIIGGDLDGFVKLIVAAGSREILGAAAVGPKAAELIHEIVVAMHFHATARDLAVIPHYHPTLSEIWTYPAEELSA